MFFQASLWRSAANKSSKNEQLCSRFSRFCEAKIMIFRYFRSSGQLVFSILRISKNFLYFSDFGDLPVTKKHSFLTHRDSDQLFVVLFFTIFGVLVFSIFYDLGCPKTQFCLAFGKTSESVVMVVNFRRLTSSRRSLFAGLDWGCVSMISFSEFYDFWVFRCSLFEIL